MKPQSEGLWSIRFSDGTCVVGDTASQALAEWRRTQWNQRSPQGWREELAKRAYVWSDTFVDTSLPATAFLQQLEKAGLIKIERSI